MQTSFETSCQLYTHQGKFNQGVTASKWGMGPRQLWPRPTGLPSESRDLAEVTGPKPPKAETCHTFQWELSLDLPSPRPSRDWT